MNNISNQFYNCVIYSITNTRLKKIYYGSTIQSLNKRIQHHKKPSNTMGTNILFKDEDENNDNIKINVLHTGNFKTIKELHTQEKIFIKNHSSSPRNIYLCINKYIPTRTAREYYLDNKERILKKNSEWARNNKEKINTNARKNYQKNRENILKKKECICGSKVCHKVFSRHLNSIKHKSFLKKSLTKKH